MSYFSGVNNFCRQLSPLLQLVGQGLTIFKILLPLLLIVLGIFDIGRAVISSKSEDIKKNLKSFFYKILVCLVVFFIPTIVMVVFGFVNKFDEMVSQSGIDFDVCFACLYEPYSSECIQNVELAS